MSKEITLLQNNSWSPEQMSLLKSTVCKGSTDDEFQLFAHACKRTGLDPFMKQIHAVKRWDGGLKREVMSIQTGIDGYRLIAERTGCYAPGREPSFVYDADKNIVSATAYVKKLTKDGTWHEIAATAYYDEYAQKTKEGRPTSFWQRMPHGQLAKCAEALALRRAFPAELSGIYTQEEMAQAAPDIADVKEVERELTVEEITEFYDKFGEEKEMLVEYLSNVCRKMNWSMNKTLLECIKNPERVRKTFSEWLSKQRPIEMEQKAQGE